MASHREKLTQIVRASRGAQQHLRVLGPLLTTITESEADALLKVIVSAKMDEELHWRNKMRRDEINPTGNRERFGGGGR